MIPVTYPSSFNASKESQMVVFALSSVAGLQRWTDYIPVKYQSTGIANSHDNNGYIWLDFLSSTTGKQAWVDYIPIYVDNTASDAWQVSANGYIPYNSLNDIISLFAGGVQGAWYDPSDSTTLFSDTTGTTPSPTPGAGALSVVGLMLDKSQGLALGSELITPVANQDFSSDTGYWTKGVGVTISGGAANFSAASGYALYRGGVLPTGAPGAYYEVTFTVTNYVSGSIRPYLGVSPTFGTAVSANGTYTQRFCPTSGGEIGFNANVAFTGSIDNVSIKQVFGNHAISYNTTTARPELSARVNLLTYSEQFDNAAWTKDSSTISANATTAPDGTNTADKVISTAVTAQIGVSQGFTAVATTYTASFSVKQAEVRYVQMLWSGGVSANYANFDLQTGTVTVASGGTATITAQANGFYKITLTSTLIAGATSAFLWMIPSGASGRAATYAGNGTDGFFVWGADLRPANIGTSVPAYQRIADQYTYDSSGFPRYLVFNGTASGMYTPANLNLSGTDKATVFAGVRKQSDAARGLITELSATAGNVGTFVLEAPSTPSGADYRFGSGGSLPFSSTATATGLTAPISNVVTGFGDISGDLTRIRVNGVQVGTGTNDQGTGNYGTYPLYVGSRNNSSLFLNGYIYSLIVVGAASTAAQISSTESWVANKQGITL